MRLFKSILPFMVLTSLFLITGLVLVIITDKQALHLSANAFVGGAADSFFAFYTHIGDGIVVPAIILVACLIKRTNFWPHLTLGLATFAISGLLAQFFKRIVFPDNYRPSHVLKDHIRLIEGVDLHAAFSFPSGHSTVSFGLFIFLAFLFREKRWIQGLAAVLAMLAAYSRVHISQHFIEDIVAGAFLGISTFYLLHWVLDRFAFKGKLAP